MELKSTHFAVEFRLIGDGPRVLVSDFGDMSQLLELVLLDIDLDMFLLFELADVLLRLFFAEGGGYSFKQKKKHLLKNTTKKKHLKNRHIKLKTRN